MPPFVEESRGKKEKRRQKEVEVKQCTGEKYESLMEEKNKKRFSLWHYNISTCNFMKGCCNLTSYIFLKKPNEFEMKFDCM